MAKKSVIARERKREKTVARFASKRKVLKNLINDVSKSYEERMEAQVKLQELPRDASPIRLRARCRISGRPRGVYRKFGLSRNFLRKLGMAGDIPGLRKSSW